MPVPTTINDLSIVASSNYPAGSEIPSVLDDSLRAHAAFIAKLRDETAAIPTNLADQTNASLGAGLVGYIINAAVGIGRTLWAKLNDIPSILDFPTVQAAFTWASINNKALFVPSATVDCGDCIVTGGLHIYGASNEFSRLRFTSGAFGLRVNMTLPTHTFSAKNITFETTGTTGYGLDLNYTPTGFADRDEARVQTENLKFEGVNRLNHGWIAPMRMTNINGSRHEKPWFNGRTTGTAANDEASNTVSLNAVVITGNEYPTDHFFNNPTFWAFQRLLDVDGAAEGITINSAVGVNVGWLIRWFPSVPFGGRPGLKVFGAHVNSYSGVSELNAIQQVQMNGGELYHNPGATSNWVGHKWNDVIDATIDEEGYFRYDANADANTSTAIAISGTAAKNIAIGKCTFGGAYTRLDIGVDIAANVNPGCVKINTDNDWNENYRVAAVRTLSLSLDQVIGERAMHVIRTAFQAIPNNLETLLAWDTKLYDPLAFFVGGATAFTIRPGMHIRSVEAHLNIVFDANASGVRQIAIKKNGGIAALFNCAATPAGLTTAVQVSKTISVIDGDVITATAFQNSGGVLNTQGSGFTALSLKIKS
jgi:hypothetical protein